MKSNLKIIFLCLCAFLYCGCTVDYNLTITNKKKIIESITVLDDNETILKYNDSVQDFLNIQKQGVDALGYDVNTLMDDMESGLFIQKNYKDFTSYTTSEYFTKLFEKANVTDVNGLFKFETSGNYYRNDVFTVDLSQHYLYDLDKVNVNIKFYNVVESHNADKVDEANNTYTWVLDKKDSYRNIVFKLKDDIRYDIMFKDFFNRNKVLIIVIFGIILLLIYGVIRFKSVIKRNNSI